MSYAVIGAGFGDEGKGRAVDYFVSKMELRRRQDAVVVRGNGGSQAGHTVVVDGKRHVFGHLGSGALRGAKTYLAENFILNPITFASEMAELHKLGVTGNPTWHANCRVTTIYDMAINSLVELKRGVDRHGSCGMGINETVTRHAAGFRVYGSNLSSLLEFLDEYEAKRKLSWLTARVKLIQQVWVPLRLKELEIDLHMPGAEPYALALEADPEKVAEELMQSMVGCWDTRLNKFESQQFVFEGAQGLQLDEFLGEFPHVTRSVTGLPSAIKAASECQVTELTPVYVTRCYSTRHGAGKMKFEGAHVTNRELADTTNVPNEWQGTMRFAPLNVDALRMFIKADLERSRHMAQFFGIEIKTPKIFLTCMDQLGDYAAIITSSNITKCPIDMLVRAIEIQTGLKVQWTAHGPEAKDVREVGSEIYDM